MELTYEVEQNGVRCRYLALCEQLDNRSLRVLRLAGKAPVVVLPEKLDEYVIEKIGHHCFSENMAEHLTFEEESSLAMINNGEVRELTGNYIEEIVLPDSVTELESYAFYNCRRLEIIEAGRELRTVNSDAFMNCRSLKLIRCRADVGDKTGMQNFLNQLNKSIEVEYTDGSRFYYPEYTESYEEIGPAHIFELNMEGEGYRARQSFNNGVMDVAAYDETFSKAMALENVHTLSLMAIDRYTHPVALDMDAREMYENYIRDNQNSIVRWLVDEKNIRVIKSLIERGLIDTCVRREALKQAARQNWTEGCIEIIGHTNSSDDKTDKSDPVDKRTDKSDPVDKRTDKSNTEYNGVEEGDLPIKRHRETETEWELSMAVRILEYVKTEIYVNMHFLEPVLNVLDIKANYGLETLATNGESLYLNPVKIMDVFKKNDKFLIRAYLHTVLHCVYSHLWLRKGRDEQLWSLACDIAVEHVIDSLNISLTKRILTWRRQNIYRKMDENNIFSAAQIYEMLKKMQENRDSHGKQKNDELGLLWMEFYTDDHSFWRDSDDKNNLIQNNDPVQKNWERKQRELSLQRKRGSESGDDEKEKLLRLTRIEKSHRDYQHFLRKFARITEVMKVSQDEFDLGFYNYGLKIYKNMPLIEPVETREIRKISEFVVVIDTSYSTSGNLVRKFLEETYSIISEEMFFGNRSSCNIRIIQADDVIQKEDVIRNRDELESFFSGMELKGGGCTDFRPVFRYVDELLRKGDIRDLGGLIYYTDGKGIYPKRRPSYKTAFVYMEDYDEEEVPAWAMRIRADHMEE